MLEEHLQKGVPAPVRQQLLVGDIAQDGRTFFSNSSLKRLAPAGAAPNKACSEESDAKPLPRYKR